MSENVFVDMSEYIEESFRKLKKEDQRVIVALLILFVFVIGHFGLKFVKYVNQREETYLILKEVLITKQDYGWQAKSAGIDGEFGTSDDLSKEKYEIVSTVTSFIKDKIAGK